MAELLRLPLIPAVQQRKLVPLMEKMWVSDVEIWDGSGDLLGMEQRGHSDSLLGLSPKGYLRRAVGFSGCFQARTGLWSKTRVTTWEDIKMLEGRT